MNARERALENAKQLEKKVSDRVEGGLQEPQDFNRAKDNVLKIEIAMLKEKMRQQGK